MDLTESRIERYKAQRVRLGRAPATINRELGALRRAYRLAGKRKLISRVPNIELLRERNAREGFVERSQFEALAAHLSPVLADFARFAWVTGWRKGEIASLTWSDVELDHDGHPKNLRLRAVNSKNDRGRFVALGGELRRVLFRRWEDRAVDLPGGSTRAATQVFHRRSKPIRGFRGAWLAACEKVGLPDLLFHDLRRSAVRNMVRAGVHERVAMAISGHRTRSVFDRYNITSEKDIEDAMMKTQEYLAEQSDSEGSGTREAM